MASLITKAQQAILLTLDKHGRASKVSTFQETGKLTPEEFVAAGDYLVQNFPSWSWSSGDAGKTRSHLPADKQYLVTRDVPALPQRLGLRIGEEEGGESAVPDEDGWIDTGGSAVDAAAEAADMEALAKGIDTTHLGAIDAAAVAAAPQGEGGDGYESADSLDELELDDLLEPGDMDYTENLVEETDEAAVGAGEDAGTTAGGGAGSDDTLVHTRTYDMNITYDVHYATPRVWLFGYDRDHNPLRGSAWRKDFSSDHVDKTVTHESHPHHGYSCPSIHPCKHAAAMKKMMSVVVDKTGGQLDAKYYMLVFLKMIQSIIPNIEYDYTGEFAIVQQEKSPAPTEEGEASAAAAAAATSAK
eukprot:UC1_evm4s1496